MAITIHRNLKAVWHRSGRCWLYLANLYCACYGTATTDAYGQNSGITIRFSDFDFL